MTELAVKREEERRLMLGDKPAKASPAPGTELPLGLRTLVLFLRRFLSTPPPLPRALGEYGSFG